ncbi:MAG: hypothetical protein WCB46_09715 [Methanoregula sp.]
MDAITGLDQFLIRGKVLYQGGEPAIGLVVRAFDKDQDTERVLGGAFTSSGGTYTIKYTKDRFIRPDKKMADIIVRVYNLDNEVLAQSNVLKEAPSDVNIDLLIPNKFSERFFITGKVNCEGHGDDLSGVIVVAYESHDGIESAIGFDDLDRSGEYRIEYSLDKIKDPNKKRHDLVVRAYHPIAEAIMDNAPENAVIDIKIIPENK